MLNQLSFFNNLYFSNLNFLGKALYTLFFLIILSCRLYKKMMIENILKKEKSFILVFFLGVLFISLITLSSASVDIQHPLNGTNHSAINYLLINVSYLNGTDIVEPTNISVYANVTGAWTNIGNISSFGNSATSYNNTGNLTLSNSSTVLSAWGYINISGLLNNENSTSLNVTLYNGTSSISRTVPNYLLKIDNTVPLVFNTNFSSPVVKGNYSNANPGLLLLNISLIDSGAFTSIQSVFFNITNSTGQANSTIIYATNSAGNYWNASINTSWFIDGEYNITAWVNDSAGNVNNTALVLNVRFDNTVPSASLSCTPSPVEQSDTLTCSCSTSDVTSGVATTINTANPSTTNSGPYTTTCSVTDYAGNAVSSNFVYTVNAVSSSGGSSGGSGSTTTPSISGTVSVDSEKLASGYQARFSKNAKVKTSFTSSSGIVGEHSFELVEITSLGVKIIITSDPITVELGKGESKEVDVDADGKKDVMITLNSLSGTKADITIKTLEVTGEPEEDSSGNVVDKVKDYFGGEDEGEKRNNAWIWVPIVLLIAIVIGVVFYIKRKN